MSTLVKLGDFTSLKINIGSIPSRITASGSDEVLSHTRIIMPKDINNYGGIDSERINPTRLKTVPKENKLTVEGDLVVELCRPYRGAKVDKEAEGCIVSSFCAVIKSPLELDNDYLLAFINSSPYKIQIRNQLAHLSREKGIDKKSDIPSAISTQMIKNVMIPLFDMDTQKEIGAQFVSAKKELYDLDKRTAEIRMSLEEKAFSKLTELYAPMEKWSNVDWANMPFINLK